MRSLFHYFFQAYNLPLHSRLFKQLLYLAVIVKCLYWLFQYELLFGPDSVIYRNEGHTNFIKDLAYVLYNNKSTMLPLYFIIAAITCSLFMLLRKRNNLTTDLALWLLVENLHYSIYATLTGGDYLLNQLLFFNIFIAIDHATDRGKERDLYVCLHNASIIAVMIQVCMVYMVSGIAKLYDPLWVDGTAVEHINNIAHFSMGWFTAEQWAPVRRLSTWLVLGYQLLFPLFIWIPKIKVPVLLLGVMMHLYIALIPGVVGFSIIMLIAYTYFWPWKRADLQN